MIQYGDHKVMIQQGGLAVNSKGRPELNKATKK